MITAQTVAARYDLTGRVALVTGAAAGLAVTGWVGDIAREAEVNTLVDRARDEIGVVDILVNTPGFGLARDVADPAGDR